jgi:predicted amidohydrolase
MEPRIGEVDANFKAMLGRFRAATAEGASLVVFPECALTGYGFDSKVEAMRFAEPVPGPSTREFAAFLGVDRFTDPGDRPFEVLDAGSIRVGMHICYDGTFPETGRVLTLLGADVLVLPTNWPVQSTTTAEHLPATRAIENVVYVMAVDRVGEERGCRFAGLSSIAGPGGEILARAGIETEEILYADVDPALARKKRLVRIPGKYELDRIADRRPGFYQMIVEPNGRD